MLNGQKKSKYDCMYGSKHGSSHSEACCNEHLLKILTKSFKNTCERVQLTAYSLNFYTKN